MFAPGSSDDDLVDNKKAKKITFTKKNGRISLKMAPRVLRYEKARLWERVLQKDLVKRLHNG